MPISVQCPGCKKRLKAREEAAGKRVKCPSCGQVVAVPIPVPAPDVDAIPPVRHSPPPLESEDNREFDSSSLPRSRSGIRSKPRSAWLGFFVILFAALFGITLILTGVGGILLMQGEIETENRKVMNPRPGVIFEHTVSSRSFNPAVVILPGVGALFFGGLFFWTFSKWKRAGKASGTPTS